MEIISREPLLTQTVVLAETLFEHFFSLKKADFWTDFDPFVDE